MFRNNQESPIILKQKSIRTLQNSRKQAQPNGSIFTVHLETLPLEGVSPKGWHIWLFIFHFWGSNLLIIFYIMFPPYQTNVPIQNWHFSWCKSRPGCDLECARTNSFRWFLCRRVSLGQKKGAACRKQTAAVEKSHLRDGTTGNWKGGFTVKDHWLILSSFGTERTHIHRNTHRKVGCTCHTSWLSRSEIYFCRSGVPVKTATQTQPQLFQM